MHNPLPVDLVRAHLQAWDLERADIEPIPPGATADVFLVTRGRERWVAKFAYDYRTYFEHGLIASEVVARAVSHPVATPRLTNEGERVVMVEWPESSWHPLAVLDYVPGEVLASAHPRAAELTGLVCGAVHRVLLEVDPAALGIDAVVEPMQPLTDGWKLGVLSWLDDAYHDLTARAAASIHEVRWSVAVWDGPDIRIQDGAVGLIDFGHTYWQPLIHAVANRSVNAAMGDPNRLAQFLEALEGELPLTEAEREVLDPYRLLNAVIYARWATTHLNEFTRKWLGQLLSYLEADLPKVGLRRPA